MTLNDLTTGSRFHTADGDFTVAALLGRGKSGAAYLITRPGEIAPERRVLKVFHGETVAYYTFGADKLEPEASAYERLAALGIAIPALIEVNRERGYLVKAYADGPTAAQLIAGGGVSDEVLRQLFDMARAASAAGINLDYFPTNFIVTAEGALIYVDYEINPYSDEWNLPNWGLWYWLNHEGMARLLATGDGSRINRDPDRGLPITEGFEAQAARLIQRFGG